MFWKRKTEKNVSNETFKDNVDDIKLRLDLIEDDIRRLRRNPKKKIDTNTHDDDIIQSIEDDGFKEIRELNKQFGSGAF